MKGSLLSKNISTRSFGHDLGRLFDRFSQEFHPGFISANDEAMIKQMVRFYDKEPESVKGIVYFENNMKEQALSGHDGLPEIAKFEAIHDKFQAFLDQNNRFINC